MIADRWRDTQARYGRVTRLLHWGMAIALGWQLAGMAIKNIVGRAPITAFWVGTHVSVGTLLMLLVVLRVGWALAQHRRRPHHDPGLVGRAATWGHRLLYALMLVVPALALARHLGSGKDLAPFGMLLVSGGGSEVAWLMAPANALHGTLAWLLGVLIVGHVAMVAVHSWWWRDGTAQRMLGRRAFT